jgi:ABC-type multidrug transport system ATPase subunit
MTAAVQVTGVTKRFRRRRPLRETLRRPFAHDVVTALDDVSFSVEPGECYGLLGENGAGKTTLFRLLATLLLPDGGRLSVHGTDVVAEPDAIRRLVAPVPPSERSLYWRLSAAHNLELFARLYRVPPARARTRIAELLDLVDLGRAGAGQVGGFSSGMRQRLLLARALLPEPRVLLLDEPTRSLDPVGAQKFRRFLKERVLGATRCTALIATHTPDEVRDLCTRVGVLHRGRLVAQGTVPELAARVTSHRLRLLTRSDPAGALALLVLAGEVTLVGDPRTGQDGVWTQDLDLPSGDPADLISQLVHAQVAVVGVERVEVPLADLLEQLTHADGARVPAHA